MPRVSIITINLNNAKGLNSTIESVVGQTYQDYEYIVIDGLSKDNSVDIIEKYSNYIHSWRSEPDQGIYHAMNKGIAQATGEYCLFINSGDRLIDNNILTNVFSSEFDEDIVYADLKIDSKVKRFPDKLSLLFFFQTSLGHPSTLIKRELFNKYGLYNENNRIVSDWEFFIKVIVNEGCSYRHLNNLVLAEFTTDGISSNDPLLLKREYETVLKRMYPLFYNDYVNHVKLLETLKFYENSIIAQFARMLNESLLMRGINKIKKQILKRSS